MQRSHPWPAHRRPRRVAVRRVVPLLAIAVLLGTGAAGPAGAGDSVATAEDAELTIDVVSGRPDMVTGGDALIRIDVPGQVAIDRVRVRLDDRDVTSSFSVDAGARSLTGVVDGMRLGENVLIAVAPRSRPAWLRLTNHPMEGPVFSGPHQQPYVCQQGSVTLEIIGEEFGEPTDANCTVAPRTDYFYRTADGAGVPWPDGATAYPDDMAYTTTTTGETVPFIVRLDTQVANRALVQTGMLDDPLDDIVPAPGRRTPGWNGDVVASLGGGCAGGWYRSGTGTGGVIDAYTLGLGFAMMSSSHNVFGNNCHDVLAAETLMMTKEIFAERYGAIDHTIGWGCSGGSYQGYQITDNYPGILDGIVVGCSNPEVAFGTTMFISDAWLMNEYFKRTDLAWTAEQKRRTAGFATDGMLAAMASSASRIRPTSNCTRVPAELRYHPTTNPTGVRCDIYDHAINVYGADPETGFARRPLDNVGVQYGLGALDAGVITPDQFLDLNEHIGGFDADANIVAERTEADLDATRIAYRTGRLTNGGGGLADIPIIEYRAYKDDQPGGDIHVRFQTFAMRERLEKANGTSANMVSLLEDDRHGLFDWGSTLVRSSLPQMHRWLDNLDAADPDDSRIAQIVAAKPADLVEGCMTPEEDPAFIAERLEPDPATACEQLYPTGSFPREVAGADVASDIVKCRLKPLARDDYAVEWTAEQWDRLTTIFPGGVCDWSSPGVEQQGLAGTWLRF